MSEPEEEEEEQKKKRKNPNDIKEIRSLRHLDKVELNLDSPRFAAACKHLGISRDECVKKYR